MSKSTAAVVVVLLACGNPVHEGDAIDGRVAAEPGASALRAPSTPDGKAIGVAPGARNRERTQLTQHGGAVLHGTTHVYLIWYGYWNTWYPSVQTRVENLVENLGGSSYFAINGLYGDSDGAVENRVQLMGVVYDPTYSVGFTLSDDQVAAAAVAPIVSQQLPRDPNGVYFVMASADVNVSSGLCESYCALHGFTAVDGVRIPYAFIPDPSRCPHRCSLQGLDSTGLMLDPTGDPAHVAGAMSALFAGELSNAVTDPFLDAWSDQVGLEPADRCFWTEGATEVDAAGARWNVHLGDFDYLLPQLWIPASRTGGSCGTSVAP